MNTIDAGRPWAQTDTGLRLTWVMTADGLRMQWTADTRIVPLDLRLVRERPAA